MVENILVGPHGPYFPGVHLNQLWTIRSIIMVFVPEIDSENSSRKLGFQKSIPGNLPRNCIPEIINRAVHAGAIFQKILVRAVLILYSRKYRPHSPYVSCNRVNDGSYGPYSCLICSLIGHDSGQHDGPHLILTHSNVMTQKLHNTFKVTTE